MSRSQRDKGARAERELVAVLREHGFDAKRTGEYKPNDVLAYGKDGVVFDKPLIFEAKIRGDGFRFLYSNLEGNDYLAVRADRKEWLIVMPLKTWMEKP